MRPSAVESRVERRARERRQDREARQIDAGLDREVRRRVEDGGGVVVEAEDEAALDRDAELVEIVDQLARSSRTR